MTLPSPAMPITRMAGIIAIARVISRRSHGFSRKEISHIRRLVAEHVLELLESWNEFFRG